MLSELLYSISSTSFAIAVKLEDEIHKLVCIVRCVFEIASRTTKYDEMLRHPKFIYSSCGCLSDLDARKSICFKANDVVSRLSIRTTFEDLRQRTLPSREETNTDDCALNFIVLMSVLLLVYLPERFLAQSFHKSSISGFSVRRVCARVCFPILKGVREIVLLQFRKR